MNCHLYEVRFFLLRNALVTVAVLFCVIVSPQPAFSQGKTLASIYAEVLARRNTSGPISPEAGEQILLELGSECFRSENNVSLTEQEEVIEVLNESWNKRFNEAYKNEDSAEGARFLAEQIKKFEADAIKSGIPVDIAGLGRFFLVKFYHDQKMVSKFNEAMLDPVLENAIRFSFKKFSDSKFRTKRTARLYGNYLELQGRRFASESDYLSAFESYEDALQVWRSLSEVLAQVDTLNNLADLHIKMGDPKQAKYFVEKAINLQNANVNLQANSQVHSQIILAKCMAPADQVQHLRKLEQRFEDAVEQGVLKIDDTSLCKNELAVALYNNGDFLKCQPLFEEVLESRSKYLDENHRLLAETEVNLGWTYLARGEKAAASRWYADAYEKFRVNKNMERESEVLSYLARALVDDDPKLARQYLEESLEIETKHMLNVLASSLSDRNRLAFLQNQRTHTESPSWPGEIDTYLELADQLKIPVGDRYRWVLIWKGVLSRKQKSNEATDSLTINRLQDERIKIRKKLFMRRQSLNSNNVTANAADDLETQFNQIERALRKATANSTPPTIEFSIDQMQQALEPSEAFLDIVEYQTFVPRNEGTSIADSVAKGAGRRYGAFLVGREQIDWIDLGKAKVVDDSIVDYLDLLSSESTKRIANDRKERNELAIEIVNQFVLPIIELKGDLKRLFVSPDGSLNSLSWYSLPSWKTDDQRFLGEVLTVNQFASADLFMASRNRTTVPTTELALFGDVDYGNGKSNQVYWNPLSNTGKEIDLLQRQLTKFHGEDRSLILKGSNATKSAAIDALKRCGQIHFATHGAFMEDASTQRSRFSVLEANQLLDSSLIFAGANDDTTGFDSVLTAEEIRGLDLQQLKLLVLSACETGLGHSQAGQGNAGLTGAFHAAGTHAIVATLWEIPDEASQLLMGYFYQHLLDNGEPFDVAESLAFAQLQLRTRHPKYTDPWYWAAWFVVGS